MPPVSRVLPAAGVLAVAITALAACGGGGTTPGATGGEGAAKSGANTLAVQATDTTCVPDKASVPAGTLTIKVTNRASKANEVHVLRADGRTIVSEREDIGPDSTVDDFTVELAAGKYQLACKPGMKGDGIRADLTVVGGPAAGAPADARLSAAVEDYKKYVAERVDDSLRKTRKFAAAVKKGDVAGAKALYAPSRVGWESIEPVAESFGDIDAKVDLREADLEKGDEWTGWHRLEKALWAEPETLKDEREYADRLVADLEDLRRRVPAAEITPAKMAGGAKELLDEVAHIKIDGEEEFFSHTDLWNFKANVDGARKVHELLKPVLRDKRPELAATLDAEFGRLQTVLAEYEEGDGYVSYEKINKDAAAKKRLQDAVNALAEPLSGLAAAVAQ
ncbi:iron uptake system protein EfeO [Bailinhaonella thermotolerans]|uniref:Iron uptake system protein EfeO n=1 Tax=Bailinhaonella thermotolerans TaxID=1070861 RepID=A0A3A4A0K2_9ACTN|nr:iron uptake system protein EfeO [Bailinhaonella thermotolerans]RJL21453.1 iron uptake system protein EfeO [Bailinhaonella thermotolerans]